MVLFYDEKIKSYVTVTDHVTTIDPSSNAFCYTEYINKLKNKKK